MFNMLAQLNSIFTTLTLGSKNILDMGFNRCRKRPMNIPAPIDISWKYPCYQGDTDQSYLYEPLSHNKNTTFPGLEDVNIVGTIRSSFEEIRKDFGPNTKTVRIDTPMENIEIIMKFLKYCPNLETLYVENCSSVLHSYYHVRQCPKVKKISFFNCATMHGDLFTFSMCPNLESLTIRKCPGMMMDFTQYKFPSLTSISTDRGTKYEYFKYSVENVPLLTNLDLSGSKHISSISVYNDYYNKCGVTDLNLSGCENLRYVSWDAFSALTTVTIDSKTNSPVRAVIMSDDRIERNILKVVQGIDSDRYSSSQ